jgi:hypothetical protein
MVLFEALYRGLEEGKPGAVATASPTKVKSPRKPGGPK